MLQAIDGDPVMNRLIIVAKIKKFPLCYTDRWWIPYFTEAFYKIDIIWYVLITSSKA